MPIPKQASPANRVLVRDEVRLYIRELILNGDLKSGETISENQIIAQLGVSRTPVREAITSLGAEGLVDLTPNRSPRVIRPSEREFISAFQALGALCGGIVRITVPVLTQDQQQEILSRVDREIEWLTNGGPPKIILGADGAYQSWLNLCPNRVLVDVASAVMSGLAYKLRIDNIEELIPPDQLISDLGRFSVAIERLDPVIAELAIKRAHKL